MNKNSEIILFVSIIVGISILLLYIYMFPKVSNFIDKPSKKEMTKDDLKITINQLLNKSFVNSYKSYDVNPEVMVNLQPYISSMVECFSNKLIEFYKKNNVYNISDIIRDINNNNIPYNFTGFCKNSVIAGISLLQNKYGKNFNFKNAVNYLLSGNDYGFSTNENVYDSNIISSSGNSGMYNFSKTQKDYLDNFKN